MASPTLSLRRGRLINPSVAFANFCPSLRRLFERLCWATAVIVFTVCASIMVYQAVDDWIETPGETKIETFSKVWMC